MEQTMKCGKVVGSQGKHIHVRFCPICNGQYEVKKKDNLEAVNDSKIKTKNANLEAVNDSKTKTKTVNLTALYSVPPEAAAASSRKDRKEKLEGFRMDTTKLSDSVPPGKEIKYRDPDRKTREVIKTLPKDILESESQATPKREGSEISEPRSDPGDSRNGVGWALAGLGSLIAIGVGILLGGRRK